MEESRKNGCPSFAITQIEHLKFLSNDSEVIAIP